MATDPHKWSTLPPQKATHPHKLPTLPPLMATHPHKWPTLPPQKATNPYKWPSPATPESYPPPQLTKPCYPRRLPTPTNAQDLDRLNTLHNLGHTKVYPRASSLQRGEGKGRDDWFVDGRAVAIMIIIIIILAYNYRTVSPSKNANDQIIIQPPQCRKHSITRTAQNTTSSLLCVPVLPLQWKTHHIKRNLDTLDPRAIPSSKIV